MVVVHNVQKVLEFFALECSGLAVLKHMSYLHLQILWAQVLIKFQIVVIDLLLAGFDE